MVDGGTYGGVGIDGMGKNGRKKCINDVTWQKSKRHAKWQHSAHAELCFVLFVSALWMHIRGKNNFLETFVKMSPSYKRESLSKA